MALEEKSQPDKLARLNKLIDEGERLNDMLDDIRRRLDTGVITRSEAFKELEEIRPLFKKSDENIYHEIQRIQRSWFEEKDSKEGIEEPKVEQNNPEKSLPESGRRLQSQPLYTVQASQQTEIKKQSGFSPSARAVITLLAIVCFFLSFFKSLNLPETVPVSYVFQYMSVDSLVPHIGYASPVFIIPIIAGVISTLRRKGFAAYYFPTQLVYVVMVLLPFFFLKK